MASREEIAEKLKEAAAAVDAADLPEDLRAVGFQRALDAVGLTAEPGSPQPESPAADLPGRGPGRGPAETDGLIARMSARLGIEVAVLSEIYEDVDGQLRLIIGPAMLPDRTRKAAAMRHVALLVAVGRQASGLEEYTALRIVRGECEDLGVLDSTNFATEVGKLGFRLQGGRNAREAKANRRHFEEASALIRSIAEASG
ncbi:MAG: hypothetical protein JOZ73_13330 [Solirubrobacterales bacterium]|nr:hypothetical protein [Solirubrobacterales bacterium]